MHPTSLNTTFNVLTAAVKLGSRHYFVAAVGVEVGAGLFLEGLWKSEPVGKIMGSKGADSSSSRSVDSM